MNVFIHFNGLTPYEEWGVSDLAANRWYIITAELWRKRGFEPIRYSSARFDEVGVERWKNLACLDDIWPYWGNLLAINELVALSKGCALAVTMDTIPGTDCRINTVSDNAPTVSFADEGFSMSCCLWTKTGIETALKAMDSANESPGSETFCDVISEESVLRNAIAKGNWKCEVLKHRLGMPLVRTEDCWRMFWHFPRVSFSPDYLRNIPSIEF